MSPEILNSLDESFILVSQDKEEKVQLPLGVILQVQSSVVDVSHPSLDPDYKPGSGTSFAHNWSSSSIGTGLRIRGRHFVDEWGRACYLRGVNVSGNCKTPVNDDHEKFPESPEPVTFVDRPFPISEAHEHLARLRRWGLTFIRFLVTWEAIEHEGPGKYDRDYLVYLRELLSLFGQYGFKVYVSMHQDVWSRYSGGSGAPAWTLDAVGLSIPDLTQTQAAWLQGVKGGGHSKEEMGLWPTGYHKLASLTMFTVFWGGEVFAPKLKIMGGGEEGGGVNIQAYLQNAFLAAWEVLVSAIAGVDCVVGFQMMNEPHPGYIGLPSLHGFDYNTNLHLGPIPSAFQGFILGSGRPATVPVWTRSFPFPSSKTSHVTIIPSTSVWRKDGPTQGQCLWEMHYVWMWDHQKNRAVVTGENYFRTFPDRVDKRPVNWYNDFYWPFLKKWAERIRGVPGCEKKWVFVEPIPNEFCPKWDEEWQFDNMVYAPHWYDLMALFRKEFGRLCVDVQGISRGMFLPKALYWGHDSARNCYGLQIRNIVNAAYTNLGERPVVIGECGVPMDLNKGEAFRSLDWQWQERMMDALTTGLERALVGFNLWNYNPANDDVKGDDWNGENFSWFSDHRARLKASMNPSYAQTDSSLDIGGRVLFSVVKPYPAKVAGVLLRCSYEVHTGEFSISWATRQPKKSGSANTRSVSFLVGSPPLSDLSGLRARETEIFVPNLITRGRNLILEGVARELWSFDESRQTLYVLNPLEGEAVERVDIRVRLDPPLTPRWALREYSPVPYLFLSILVVLLAVLYLQFIRA